MSSHSSNYAMNIKSADIEEMRTLIEWANSEGWNPGLTDALSFQAADPQGFLIGYIDGNPVASISAVRYPGNFGFIGFYIVHPAWRARGYGWQIWQAGMRYLAGCNIALDGVLAEQENYQRSGFKLAWRNIRFEGKAGTLGESTSFGEDMPIIGLTDVAPEILSVFDRQYFPADRTNFLQSWIRQAGTTSLGIQDEGGKLAAYGVIRPCYHGFKVGPLCARNPKQAQFLLGKLLTYVPVGQAFYIDVPSPNPAAKKLADDFRMTAVFETARMYTSTPPKITIDQIYGITSFELG